MCYFNLLLQYRKMFLFLYLVMLLGASATGLASEKLRTFKIDDESDTAYLPYSVEIRDPRDQNCGQVVVLHPLLTVTQKIDSNSRASYLYSFNSCPQANSYSHLLWNDYNSQKLLGETPVRSLIISDMAVLFESLMHSPLFIGSGFWNDSAFLFKWTPSPGGIQRIFIATGKDQNGNGKWEGTFAHVGTMDYDYDGQMEMFFYLNAERDISPRVLVCLEANSMKVEWSIPVASLIQTVVNCYDSLDPGILFIAAPQGQGAEDSNFSNNYGYCVRVNSKGRIVFSRVSSYYPIGNDICESRIHGEYYIRHSIPFQQDTVGVDKIPQQTYITRIDSRGNILYQYVDTSSFRGAIWTGDYDQDNEEDIYLYLRPGIMKILNSNLIPIAESQPGDLNGYVSTIDSFDGKDRAFVLQDGDGTAGIYDQFLHKLAQLPGADYMNILSRGSVGAVTGLTICNTAANGVSYVALLEKRGFWEYVAIFYKRNQLYVLLTLCSLLVGLIVSNYYRRQTHRNLLTIKNQKTELEKTHEELKQAQETIIAQEKYRHARDIAGMFAHEIRNTLFPAEAVLTKMELLEGEQINRVQKPQYRQILQRAVQKAIRMTDLISQYVKLESQYLPEKVNLHGAVTGVINEYSQVIESARVKIELRLPEDTEIQSNSQQLGILMSNLLSNSLEALTDTAEPSILICGRSDQNGITMEFTDNGCGIPDADLPKVLNNIYSTKPTTGLGIGLINCRKIIEMYGGSISIKSKEGVGTTLFLQFRPFS